MGSHMRGQRILLLLRQLTRPMTTARTGHRFARPTPSDQRLVDVGNAYLEYRRNRPHRHSTIHRRQHTNTKIRGITPALMPSHRSLHNILSSVEANHTFPCLGISKAIPVNLAML